jgi:cell division transport system permease protein
MGLLRMLGYFLSEGVVALMRHKTLHGFALFIVALSLYVLGFSLYLTGNVNALLASWERNLEVRVFLEDGTEPARREALERRFGAHPLVASVRRVSPDEALRHLSGLSPAFGAAARTLRENPLPDSLSLALKSPVDLDAVKRLVASAQREEGVEQVLFDWDWVEKLKTYTRFVALLGGLLFVALSVAAVFTVAAVTRILALSRREEIAILRFVGATELSIRGPFVAGGFLLGALAGVLALAGLFATHLLVARFAGSGALFLQWLSQRFLSVQELLLLLGVGTLLSATGGGLSFRASTAH